MTHSELLVDWWPMSISPQRRCPFWSETHEPTKSQNQITLWNQNTKPKPMKSSHRTQTHEPRPTKSNHPVVKLYLNIGGNTPKSKWISCPVAFGIWSSWPMNPGGQSLNREIERNRSYGKERRGKWERREKKEEKNKKEREKVTIGNKKKNIWFNIYTIVNCYW